MAEINNNDGIVQVSNEVLATIAQTAAMEVEGVFGTTTGLANEIIEKFGKKSSSKGIVISIENKMILIDINLAIKLNYRISDIAEKVQKKVKNAIESMTGIEVYKVNINIVSVEISKDKPEEIKDAYEK